MKLDGPHCLAARKFLGWSRNHLAREANTSAATVRAFEQGAGVHINHLDAIERALTRAGVTVDLDGFLVIQTDKNYAKIIVIGKEAISCEDEHN
jgi:transcriptional regulator with XRE-family HTH domain